MSPAATGFFDRLRELQLLPAEQLAEVADMDRDAGQLAQELTRRGWLSAFQAHQLLTGGDLVVGNYQLIDRIGAGGMGTVFKAKHRALGRIVALKTIHPGQLDSSEAVQRFLRETRAAARLDHPHIVHAYDSGKVGRLHFLAMELVEGADLGQLVKSQGRLEIADASDYVRQAALGLQHAHERGLVHRDIKPSNLFLTRAGAIKILDFGLVRLEKHEGDQAALTQSGAIYGSPDFVAPEQALDARSADSRADVYSLGSTLYFLLTAHKPFPVAALTQKLVQLQFNEPKAVEELRPEIPSELASLVRKLMAKKPDDRCPSAGEAAGQLESIVRRWRGALAGAARLEAATPASTPAKGRKRYVLAALTMLILLGMGWGFWGRTSNEAAPDKRGTSKTPAVKSVPLQIQVSATITADNHYALYHGDGAGEELTLVGRNELGPDGKPGRFNWSEPETWKFNSAKNDYLYVVAWDDDQGQWWLAQFQLGAGSVLRSNLTDWEYCMGGSNPGVFGRAPALDELRTHLRSASWKAPAAAQPIGSNATLKSVPGFDPQAEVVWHDTLNDSSSSDRNYVIFRTRKTIAELERERRPPAFLRVRDVKFAELGDSQDIPLVPGGSRCRLSTRREFSTPAGPVRPTLAAGDYILEIDITPGPMRDWDDIFLLVVPAPDGSHKITYLAPDPTWPMYPAAYNNLNYTFDLLGREREALKKDLRWKETVTVPPVTR